MNADGCNSRMCITVINSIHRERAFVCAAFDLGCISEQL